MVRTVAVAVAKANQDPNLDILRSVAVLAVFATHTLQNMAGCKFGERFAFGVDTFSLGRIGVLLFFVHTSLVLMQSLERTGTKLAGGSLTAHFYIKRAFRIYPLSICLILASFAFSIPPTSLGDPYIWRGAGWAAANLLLVQNITGSGPVSGPLWSLPYEVQMYLILPALFLVLRLPGSWVRLILIYLIGALLSVIHPLLGYLPCFLAGVVAYKLLEALRPRLPAWFWGPAVIGIVVLFILTPQYYESWTKNVLTCLFVGVLIPLFRRRSGAVSAVASRIAKYSYGIYLCHTPVLWLLYQKLTIPAWQQAIWLIVGTGGASVACYYAIEHPLIQLGTRLSNRIYAKPRAVAAVAAG